MIKEKIYYYVQMELKSPLSVGNGNDFLTDHDCVRNGNGYVFIPATSLAGIFSHYLNEEQRKLFAPMKNGEYLQSPYFISDASVCYDNSDNIVKTSIRDGVKLLENKTAEKSAKYDFEVVETGTKFDFRIELTIRDKDSSEEMKNIVDVLLNGLNNGEILIGLKSKRGYGKVKIVDVKSKSFEAKDLTSLLNFNKYDTNMYDTYEVKSEFAESRYDYLEVNLEQIGGLSIRKYSATANEADFEHIKSNGKPVIPGTSWSGLIRKQIKNYLNEDMLKSLDVSIDNWFGNVNPIKKVKQASNIIIEESQIENAKEITLTRNKINRFSGGATDRALFTEKAVYNGNTTLGIKVKKEIKRDGKIEKNTKVLGLIALTIKDIDNGIIALGGQTSIGRGLFKVNECRLNGEKFDLDQSISNIFGGDFVG